jgi:glycosyltransferase involved in cell wall biosynthesis
VRIGFFTELFPPSVGGQEYRFSELADALAGRGHRVVVLAVRHRRDLAGEEERASGVQVLRRPSVRNYCKPLGGLLPRSPIGIARYALAARRLMREQDFDAVFLNQWPLLHILALPGRDRPRAVVDWCEIRTGLLFRLLQRALPKMAGASTAVSTQVAQHIAARTNRPVLLLPSGIERSRYRSDPLERRQGLLYLGRLTAHKNLALLIDAYEELCRRGWREKLTIAGDGPELETVRARVRRSPFAARIDLTGLVSEERKQALLAGSRVLLLTSRREGFPRAAAEAMASGLPLVTARFPDNGTVSVAEEFGCGIAADPTAEAIARATETVVQDWMAWSARAVAGAEKLDWTILAEQFERFLRREDPPLMIVSPFTTTPGILCESS